MKNPYIYIDKTPGENLIAMSSDLESSIRRIEETNNPDNAYFSYSVDDTGEYGLIKANKEGLRLYAAELLKESLLLEEEDHKEIDPIFFTPKEWMFSETGYNLIAGILPQYESRQNILAGREQPVRQAQAGAKKKPVLMFVLMCITGALIMLATLKAFPNLRIWVNIH
jgi:hypothetical protein